MKQAGFDEIRSIQFEILKAVAEFCDANGVQYFLTGGTLLGAVRHQGFIPWDDDIDIAMPRPDYNRFLTLSQGRLGSRYDVSVLENNPAHSRLFMRVMDNRTLYVHKYYRRKYRTGLGIDVFPMDGVPERKEECEAYFREIRKLNRQFALAQSAPFKSTNFVRAVFKTAAMIPASVMGRERPYRKIMRLVSEYPYEASRRVGITTGVYFEKEILEKADIYPAADLPFEGHMFHVPACYEMYLTQLYGDYRKLPGVEDQKPKHAFSVYWK